MGPGQAALPLTVNRSCGWEGGLRAGDDTPQQGATCAAAMPSRHPFSQGPGLPQKAAASSAPTECCLRHQPRHRPQPQPQPAPTLRAAAAAAACCWGSMCRSRQVSRWEYMVGPPMKTVTGSSARCGPGQHAGWQFAAMLCRFGSDSAARPCILVSAEVAGWLVGWLAGWPLTPAGAATRPGARTWAASPHRHLQGGERCRCGAGLLQWCR